MATLNYGGDQYITISEIPKIWGISVTEITREIRRNNFVAQEKITPNYWINENQIMGSIHGKGITKLEKFGKFEIPYNKYYYRVEELRLIYALFDDPNFDLKTDSSLLAKLEYDLNMYRHHQNSNVFIQLERNPPGLWNKKKIQKWMDGLQIINKSHADIAIDYGINKLPLCSAWSNKDSRLNNINYEIERRESDALWERIRLREDGNKKNG